MSQYCRACGADLRSVRVSMERPDSITASAVSARAEIGRAIADRIREVNDARELKMVTEDILPKIEKFLESPDEKRLRRMRAGIIVSSVGLGTALLFLLLAMVLDGGDAESMLGLFGLGATTFFIGLGLILNAMLFTRPRKGISGESLDGPTKNELDALYTPPQLRAEAKSTVRSPATNDLGRPIGSVTESTTHHLKRES